MTYKFSQTELDEALKGSPQQPSYKFSQGELDRALSGAPQQPSGLQSFAAGVVNPLISAANLVPELAGKATSGIMGGLGKLASRFQSPSSVLPSPLSVATSMVPSLQGAPLHQAVPTVPYSPGLSHGLGELAGFALPYGAAESAVGHLGGLAGKGLLSSLGRGAAAGAAAGYAGTPTSEGRRGGALGGGIGGALGEAITPVARAIFKPLLKIKAFSKTKEGFAKSAGIKAPENAQADLINDVLSHYNISGKKAAKNYGKVWSPIGKEGIPVGDMKNVSKLIAKEKTKYGDPFYDLKDFEDFPRNEKGNISPEDLHYKKSEAFRRSKSVLEPTSDKIRHKKYYNAMKGDLEDYLNKKGTLKDYQSAAVEWKKHMLPFKDSAAFRRIFKDSDMRFPEEGEKGLDRRRIAVLSDTARSSKLAKQFLPTGTEEDISKLKELQSLLGGNKEEAATHLKNMMLSKFVNGEGDFNFKGLLNYVEGKKGTTKQGLSSSQKAFIFSPEERKIIRDSHAMAGTSKLLDGKIFKALSAMLLWKVHPVLGHYGHYLPREFYEGVEKVLKSIPTEKLKDVGRHAPGAISAIGAITGQQKQDEV